MPSFHEITADHAAQLCPIYFQDLAEIGNLATAAELTERFRGHSGYGTDVVGFIMDADTVRNMLRQNDGDIAGIRVYLGIETLSPLTFKGVGVATVLNGHEHDDFHIPLNRNDPCDAILAEARPCPIHCSKVNALNT